MTNIIEILKGFNITIPEDKLGDFNKTFNENYKTIVEHQKALDKIAGEKKRADTAEEALKGFDGIDPANIQKQLKDANDAVAAAKAEAQKQIEERDADEALRAEASRIKFTSEAAKRDFLAYMKEKGYKAENGKIIGFNDRVNLYKSENPDAMATEGAPPPRFTSPNVQTNSDKSLTVKDIRAIKDPVERQNKIKLFMQSQKG